jgi:hypothetical protein
MGSYAAFQNQNGWLYTYSPTGVSLDTEDGVTKGTSPGVT